MDVGGRTVWSEVTHEQARGEFVAVLGANGSGKSTLLKAVLGMLGLSAGSIRVLGRPAGSENAQVGYLPAAPRVRRRHAAARARTSCGWGCDGERWGLPLPVAARGARLAAPSRRHAASGWQR